MEEVVRAFNWVIEKGWAFYWGTSEWSAREVEEAIHIAHKLNLIAPIAEQCCHHMFHRERPEKEYEPLYRKYDYGTTVFSGLAQGLLTGKVRLYYGSLLAAPHSPICSTTMGSQRTRGLPLRRKRNSTPNVSGC